MGNEWPLATSGSDDPALHESRAQLAPAGSTPQGPYTDMFIWFIGGHWPVKGVTTLLMMSPGLG